MQEASALSTKHFRSSRYVFKMVSRFGLRPGKGQPPLRVLEVGAVNAQLAVCPWMHVRAIDLMSRDPRIEARDFFDVVVGTGPDKGPVPQTRTRVAYRRLDAAARGASGSSAGAAAGASDDVDDDDGADDSDSGDDGERRASSGRAAGQSAAAGARATSAPDADAARTAAPTSFVAAHTDMPCNILGGYDVVVNAMVVNCVPDPVKRAEMLIRCR
jgi:hypothetical protein